MAVDGIKIIKKYSPKRKNGPRIQDPYFWDIKKNTQSKTEQKFKFPKLSLPKISLPKINFPNINFPEWNWPKTSHIKSNGSVSEISKFLFAKRTIVSVVGVFVIFAIMSVSASSYNIISQNYDFVKLFKTGNYLILFQNNTEMRATGGFLGSFAVAQTSNGLIKDTFFETNIYKRDNPFIKDHSVQAPDPVLAQFEHDGKWVMRDSNWAIDFPTAAQQIDWFYKNEITIDSQRASLEGLGSGKEQIDGVVAINATVMTDILKIIGPINLSKYNATISSDNFISTIQYQVEDGYYVDSENKTANIQINEPKTILKDMMPIVMDRIKSAKYSRQILDLVHKELLEKQILFFFYDGNKEQIAVNNNWGGEVKQTEDDYLYVNNSNLGSNKSSLNTLESLDLNSSSENGVITNTLTITRTHTGTNVFPDGLNKNYVRVLVPYGAKLVTAEADKVGFLNEIIVTKEAGKTEFGFWINTYPQSSHIIKISYQLPESIDTNNYSLLMQKQPGNLGDDLKVTVNGNLKFSGVFNQDKEIK